MSLLSNDCNLRAGPEQRWAREPASTRPSSETCGDLFGFKIHFYFLVLSLSTDKEHLLSPRFRDSLVLMLKSLLLTFPSILVRTPSCLRILRIFEEYEEKQKTYRILRNLKNTKKSKKTSRILRNLKNTKKSKKPPGSTQLYSIWDFHAFSQLSLEMELLDFHIKEVNLKSESFCITCPFETSKQFQTPVLEEKI